MPTPNNTAEIIIARYIEAKDQNRPHLMSLAFEDNAILTMQVESSEIEFPAQVNGRQAISQTLVRDFAGRFENIYTYCLTQPDDETANGCQLNWLVVMTERASGNIKLGYGRYDWLFNSQSGLCSKLHIHIEHMQVVSAPVADKIYQRISDYPTPWQPASALLALLDDHAELSSAHTFLTRAMPS